MTRFLQDILRQPKELEYTHNLWNGTGRAAMEAAAQAVRSSRHVYLTGIGSSWHAALNVGAMFYAGGCPVYMQDAAELLHYTEIPRGAVLIVISRSGRSIEIVGVTRKAREAGARVIGITNVADGTLAQEADFPLVVPITLDHAISVNTYTTLALTAGILAATVTGAWNEKISAELSRAFAETEKKIPEWRKQIEISQWIAPGMPTYFLGRGTSLGSAFEARLLWEEGVKSPATANGSASFRHGPQEMIREGMRFGIWADGATMREQDFAVSRDLGKLHASVMLIGQNLPRDAAELLLELPQIPAMWQFAIDMIPAQLAAERLAQITGVDADTFRLCSFIVEDEMGLLPKENA